MNKYLKPKTLFLSTHLLQEYFDALVSFKYLEWKDCLMLHFNDDKHEPFTMQIRFFGFFKPDGLALGFDEVLINREAKKIISAKNISEEELMLMLTTPLNQRFIQHVLLILETNINEIIVAVKTLLADTPTLKLDKEFTKIINTKK